MPALPSAFSDLPKLYGEDRCKIQGVTVRVKNTFLDDVDYGSHAPAARRCSSAGRAMQFTERESRTLLHAWQRQVRDSSSELGLEGTSSEELAIPLAEPRDTSESDELPKRPCKSRRDRCSSFTRYVERLLEEDPLADLRLLAPPAFISKSQWLQNKVYLDVMKALGAAGRNPCAVAIPWLPPAPTLSQALSMGANKWASNSLALQVSS
mmetsp:Transcript_30401/g.82311  ORF Transcript_30401/g.82311 Transcript_30401/m.82311 type:complete len:209 (-) Transcript_30401:353-979(-)